jgi:hypothetical protein
MKMKRQGKLKKKGKFPAATAHSVVKHAGAGSKGTYFKDFFRGKRSPVPIIPSTGRQPHGFLPEPTFVRLYNFLQTEIAGAETFSVMNPAHSRITERAP